MTTLAPLNNNYVKAKNTPFPNLFPQLTPDSIKTDSIASKSGGAVQITSDINAQFRSITCAQLYPDSVETDFVDCNFVYPEVIDVYKNGHLYLQNQTLYPSAGTNSPLFLGVFIDGQLYKIALRNP